MRRIAPLIVAALLLPLLAAGTGAASESTPAPDTDPHGTDRRAAAPGLVDRMALYESIEQPADVTPTDADVTAAALTGTFTWVGDGAGYCNGEDAYLDAPGDAAVDLVMVRSEGVCDAVAGFDVHLAYTAQPGTNLDFFEVGVDLDLDLSTGCDGWDAFAIGGPGGLPAWVASPTCDPASFSFVSLLSGADNGTQDLSGQGVATSAMSVRIPDVNRNTVAWYAITVGTDGGMDALDAVFFTPAEVLTCEGAVPATSGGDGYWLSTLDGEIFPLGAAPDLGHVCEQLGARSVVDLALADDGTAWTALQADGSIRTPDGSGAPALDRRAPWPWEVGATQAVALIGNATAGEWTVVYDNGAVVDTTGRTPFGDARALPLNGPMIDARATPERDGYWLIGSDGGVFSFGDARFSGSTGSLTLNAPVVGMAPDPDGEGYWLVASDGGVFAFDAPFVGSLPGELAPGTELNRPIVAMVPYGNGYLLLGSDGGVFSFSDRAFAGSLGADPPVLPVIAVQPVPAS